MENITIKSKMNKTMQAAYERYEESTDTELWQVYGRYSHAKRNAMEYCRELCYKLDGHGLRIISHNTMCFSVGFEFTNPTNGAECFAYITRDNNRFCEL